MFVILLLGSLVAALGGHLLPEPLARHVPGALGQLGQLAEIFGLASVIMVMGLIDDIKNLDWRPRLGLQVGCAAILAATGIRITLFGPFTHPLIGGRGDGPLDRRADQRLQHAGQHGRPGGERRADRRRCSSAGRRSRSATCSCRRSCWSWSGRWGDSWSTTGPPPGCSWGMRGATSWASCSGRSRSWGPSPVRRYSECSVLAPLLVMAVPLYDMTSVILIRLREGRSPFKADRRHFSHRLVARGLTPPQAVWTIDLVTLAGGLGALLLHRLDWPGRRWCWARPSACWESWPSWKSRRAVRSKAMARRGARSSVPLNPPRAAAGREA